jgi:branched-chain amino acid transport system permease protein
MKRYLAWCGTGLLIGLLTIGVIVVLPNTGEFLHRLCGDVATALGISSGLESALALAGWKIDVDPWFWALGFALAGVLLIGAVAVVFYVISGAIGRRIEFKSSDLSLFGTSMLLTVGLLVPHAGVYPVFVMKVLCFALFACAFNLLVGFVGLLSFGHAAYFGSAGYIAGHVAKVWGWPPEAAILAATGVAAALGAVFGGIAIRRQGIYFAMITLALAQMVYFFALQAKFTGGEDGIQAVPRGVLFGVLDLNQPLAIYYTVFAIFLAGFALIYRTIHSPFGQVLKAIRENEARAISLGYSVDRYKLVAFILSAGLAGLAGGTKTIVFQLASLTDVDWTMSGEVVLMTLLGGIGTVFGPIVGAVIDQAIENYFAQVGAWVTIITGAIFVACVLLFRRGIVGVIGGMFQRRMASLSPAPTASALQPAPRT